MCDPLIPEMTRRDAILSVIVACAYRWRDADDETDQYVADYALLEALQDLDEEDAL